MKWWPAVVAGVACLIVAAAPQPAEAAVMRIQPLQYESSLKAGEKKKGFVDITNPSEESVKVRLYVQGFTQLNDKGELRFFADEQLAKGIQLDYGSAELGPRQALRLFFLIDGAKLPTGDSFAVIFAETVPAETTGPRTTARVGTLLMLTNQTPGSRTAEIARLDVAPVQIGGGVEGVVAVRNPARQGAVTGYRPTVRVQIAPVGGEVVQPGPLVMAGRTRTVDFYKPTNLFGIYAVTVQANEATMTRYAFLVTGWWRLVAPLLFGALVLIVVLGWRWWRRARRGSA